MSLADCINLAIAICTAAAAVAAWVSASASLKATEQANKEAEESRKIAQQQTEALMLAAQPHSKIYSGASDWRFLGLATGMGGSPSMYKNEPEGDQIIHRTLAPRTVLTVSTAIAAKSLLYSATVTTKACFAVS